VTRRVVIVQELLPQYRVPFFEGLRSALAEQDIELCLVHGHASGARAQRKDEASIPWATVVRNRRLTIRGRDVAVWQPALGAIRQADLVIIEHANRFLLNYLLLLRRPTRLAFWGHGGNLQTSRASGSRERFKRWTARRADWWFAYTEGSAQRVEAAGFPLHRITVVNNSTDTSIFDGVEQPRIKGRTIFVGGLDGTKRLGFLLEAAEAAHTKCPSFSLVVVGDGPQRTLMVDAAAKFSWFDYLGPQFGADKAAALKSAGLLLMPGLVGLAAIDSLAAGTPMLTVDSPTHSPEFEYLDDDRNAVILPEGTTAAAYGAAAAALSSDSLRLEKLRDGCRLSASEFSLNAMIRRFREGVQRAIAA
jgi:glycosyltransferase involved in cell wall biosynthesis